MSTPATPARLVVSLDDAGAGSVDEIGLKGWYLSRLRGLGYDTPNGFVVVAAAYEAATRDSHVDQRLHSIWAAARNASGDDIAMLARKARHLIAQIRFDGALTQAIGAALVSLAAITDEASDQPVPVAVRSSTAPGAVSGPECAGVHASFTDVVDLAHVISRIHSCWASLFGERALAMRARGLGAEQPTMAVVVQLMVHAEKSGLAIPLDTSSDLLVESTFGLGEPIISGAVEPDRYVIDRTTSVPTSVRIGHKRIVLRGGAGHAFMPPERQTARVLDDRDIARISRLSASVDNHFGAPHEIEWALLEDTLHVLQVRPLTPGHAAATPTIDRTISGIGVGLGFATGRVRIALGPGELEGATSGDILVTTETTPEWTPHLERVGAVITDLGDDSCHAARVARELGIPAIVGTGTATTMLEDGLMVTVDATRGWVLPVGAAHAD
jgi:pyruvate,water dikinase